MYKDYRSTEEETAKATEATPQYVLYKSRVDHLIALGLVGPKSWEHSNDMAITKRGGLLLHEVGIVSEKVRADSIGVNAASLFTGLRKKRVELIRHQY